MTSDLRDLYQEVILDHGKRGLGLLIGGVVGSVVPGAVVSATGSFDAALRVIVGVALHGRNVSENRWVS